MTNRNYGLDVLRAMAIILVLICHALFFMIQAFPQSNSIKIISYLCGFFGVEIFFVLSGFLIGHIIRKKLILNEENWLIFFWIGRLFRIMPCYLFFLLLNIFLFYYIENDFPDSLLSYLILSQNLAWQHPNFFSEAWSLSIEGWFYFLFPSLIIIFIKFSGFRVSNAYLASAIIFLIISTTLRIFYASLYPSAYWDTGFRKVVVLRLDSFIYGVYLSWLIDYTKFNHKNLFFYSGMFVLSISIIVYLTFDHDHSYISKIIQFSITSLGFALIIPYMLNFTYANSKHLGLFLKKTSLWSYSMYLSNFLIYNMIQNFIFHKYFNENPKTGAFLCLILLIILCYLISAIIYRAYELPLTSLREPCIKWLKNYYKNKLTR